MSRPREGCVCLGGVVSPLRILDGVRREASAGRAKVMQPLLRFFFLPWSLSARCRRSGELQAGPALAHELAVLLRLLGKGKSVAFLDAPKKFGPIGGQTRPLARLNFGAGATASPPAESTCGGASPGRFFQLFVRLRASLSATLSLPAPAVSQLSRKPPSPRKPLASSSGSRKRNSQPRCPSVGSPPLRIRSGAQTDQASPVFCDYCDVYLTHDSMSVRKAHNSGRNHLRNVVDYYQRTCPPSLIRA
jgi:hypothetical protein